MNPTHLICSSHIMLHHHPTSTLFPYTTLFRSPGVVNPEELERLWEEYAAKDAHSSQRDRKSTRLDSSHSSKSYAGFCLKERISDCSESTCCGALCLRVVGFIRGEGRRAGSIRV